MQINPQIANAIRMLFDRKDDCSDVLRFISAELVERRPDKESEEAAMELWNTAAAVAFEGEGAGDIYKSLLESVAVQCGLEEEQVSEAIIALIDAIGIGMIAGLMLSKKQALSQPATWIINADVHISGTLGLKEANQ